MIFSRAVRALSLAIMAKTSEDLEKLLLPWEVFCDRHHMETQIAIADSLAVTEAGPAG